MVMTLLKKNSIILFIIKDHTRQNNNSSSINSRGADEISPWISDRMSVPRRFWFYYFYYFFFMTAHRLVFEEAYYCPPTHTPISSRRTTTSITLHTLTHMYRGWFSPFKTPQIHRHSQNTTAIKCLLLNTTCSLKTFCSMNVVGSKHCTVLTASKIFRYLYFYCTTF